MAAYARVKARWDLTVTGSVTPIRSGGGVQTQATLRDLPDGDYTFRLDFFAEPLGILFGTFAARFAGTFLDTAITVFALIFYAMPIFWVALMGILLFSVTFDWLPSFGYDTVGGNYTGLAHVVDVARHLVMPAMTLGTLGWLAGALAALGGMLAFWPSKRLSPGAAQPTLALPAQPAASDP